LQEVSRVCKMPANLDILRVRLFLSFQSIRPGCCTVAAHKAHWAGLEFAIFSNS
jgi:hypothetical protein